ncbi:MAG: LysE family translocator, partial [Pseudomonadota bacterium]
VLFGAGLDGWQVLGFAPIGCASAILVYGAYAWLFSSAPVRGLYARLSRGFEALFGTAFGLIGGGLLIDGLRDLARRA